ncbi:DUF4184 family protein [Acinetobacter ihumii]|uniref:DUF4184 family protein n=1 Tax=Acinetobacter ihumii TaxID=2483802 RepID=UPI0010314943|nr:DUF4184 family protein [Acinetobacter ihumii]
MPFTLSHAVLAPPIAKLTRHTLPVAALAIGCMTPDLVRLFTDENITISHEWSGLIIPNLLLGLGFCLVWYLLYRPVLYQWLALQDDLNFKSLHQFCGFAIACMVGIMVGCVTHIVWDGLTHDDFRTFAFQDFLGQALVFFGRTYPVHRFLQLATSIVSLPILGWMCYRYFIQHRIAQQRSFFLLLSLVVLLSCATGSYAVFLYLQHIDPQLWHTETYVITGKAINYFCRGFLISFSLSCLIFILLKFFNQFQRKNDN